jgi:hypothetical protein
MSVPTAYVPSASMVVLGAVGGAGAGGGGAGSGSAWAVAADAAEPTRTITAATTAVLVDFMNTRIGVRPANEKPAATARAAAAGLRS